jgi:lipopolysaccharide biosynthesis glycosyltransferase
MSNKAICTIITKSYLAYARTLAKSILKHHPEITLYVLLVDQVDESFNPDIEPFKLIHLENLSDQLVVEQMCFYYTAFELCCALRGLLHEYMFNQTSAQSWLFLDSDIMVFHPLDSVFEELQATSILLTPHCTTPVSEEHIAPHEIDIVSSGLYNGGFLGLRRSEETKKFIDWFKTRLKFYSLNDLGRGQFVDQNWLNLVPLYFKDSALCSEPGANLGHWNLFEKELTKDGSGMILVDGKPILFIHFSGWDIESPEQISKYAPMYRDNTPSLWSDLAEAYQKNLLENGYYEFKDLSYTFNYFSDGKLILPEFRRIQYDNMLKGKDFQKSPFLSSKFFSYLLEQKKINKMSFIRRVAKKIKNSCNFVMTSYLLP